MLGDQEGMKEDLWSEVTQANKKDKVERDGNEQQEAYAEIMGRLSEIQDQGQLAILENLRQEIINCQETTGTDVITFMDVEGITNHANVFKNWNGGDLFMCKYWLPGLKESMNDWSTRLKEKGIKVGYMEMENKRLPRGFLQAVPEATQIANDCNTENRDIPTKKERACSFSAYAAESDADFQMNKEAGKSNRGFIRILEQVKSVSGKDSHEVALTNAWDPLSLAGGGHFRDGSLNGQIGRGTAVAVLAWAGTNQHLLTKENMVAADR